MFPEFRHLDVIALDTEATGLNYPVDKAFMFSLSCELGDFEWDVREEPEAIQYLKDELAQYKGEIAMHYASFDVRMFSTIGIQLPLDRVRCTSVQACLINEHEATIFPWTRTHGGYSLDFLGEKYLQMRKDQEFYDKARDYFGDARMSQERIMSKIAELPRTIVAPYAMRDTRVTYELYLWQLNEIEKQGIWDIVWFERKVFTKLVKAEMRGIHVDVACAEAAQPKLTVKINEAQKELNKIAGFDINVNSSPQIKKLFEPREVKDDTGEIYWMANDGTPLERAKSGGASFGGKTMHNMKHPAANLIIQIRSLIKTRDTFLGKHIIAHAVNGVVYPNINQCKGEDAGTGTGRLSYTDPALQQIPARNKEIASIVKPCFLPPPGMKWAATDLASFEVRVFAHLVAAYNDELVRVYAKNPAMDFHQYVADLTGLPRNATYSGQANAKQLNLSMIFNQGNGTTAEVMGMPWSWDSFKSKEGVVRYKKAGEEAMDVINLYHSKVKGVKTLAEKAKSVAEQRGYIKTKMGRRLRFPKGYKSYKASGLLIQSTAADWNKRNWIVIDDALGNDGHLILNTHDSYDMALPEDWRPHYRRAKEAIQDISDIGSRVPILLDLDGVGSNWWAAKCGEEK